VLLLLVLRTVKFKMGREAAGTRRKAMAETSLRRLLARAVFSSGSSLGARRE